MHAGSEYIERGHTMVRGASFHVPAPGMYDLRIIEQDGTSYSGRILLDGNITMDYRWKARVAGEIQTFSASYTYLYSDYLAYAQDGIARKMISEGHESRFITTDDTTKALANSLKASYLDVMGAGASTSGQDYAEFLLSFVQYSVDYPDTITSTSPHVESEDGSGDLFLYGETEYWAFPLETIHHGYGDCEDTSFLLASLYLVSGYPCAVPVIPGHMVVCVSLPSFTKADISTNYIATKLVDSIGRNLYPCETAYDYAQYSYNVPVSYVSQDVHEDLIELKKIRVYEPEPAPLG